MITCPICKKEFEEKTGRRPKRFCSEGCKDAFWNTQKKVAKKKIQNLSKPTNEVKPAEQPKSNYVIDTQKISELEKELAAIPDTTKGLGKLMAKSLQDRIYKLKYEI